MSSTPRHVAVRPGAGERLLGAVVVGLTVATALLTVTTGGELPAVAAAWLGVVAGFGLAFGVLVGRRRLALDGRVVG